MPKSITRLKASAVVIITLALPSLINAQSDRTWISGAGDDASPSCSRTAPCKTFQGALARTNVGVRLTVSVPAASVQ
jgi:hypothetical protein